MKFADRCGAQGQLAPRQSPALHRATIFRVVHIGDEPSGKFHIGYAGLEVEPRVVNIDRQSHFEFALIYSLSSPLTHPFVTPPRVPHPPPAFLSDRGPCRRGGTIGILGFPHAQL
jgi:hypothetical protein